MKQIDIREGALRQHRTLSLFSVIQCWNRGFDGLVFTRTHLERILGLERFKRTRVEWLQEDLKDFFPYQSVYWLVGKKDSLHSFFISRVPVEDFLPKGEMTTKKRLKGISKKGPKLDFFRIWERPNKRKHSTFEGMIPFFADYANYDERLMASYLNLLVQGQISPNALPPLVKDEDDEQA